MRGSGFVVAYLRAVDGGGLRGTRSGAITACYASIHHGAARVELLKANCFVWLGGDLQPKGRQHTETSVRRRASAGAKNDSSGVGI